MANTILTGIRSNNNLHIGNYLGAIKPMVQLQKNLGKDDQLFMFVPDLHSFTTPIDHSQLYKSTIDTMRVFLASGIDPEHSNTYLYRQSHVPAHSQLTWILNCFTYFGEASRMTEFKDKSERLGSKAVTVGLFDYPVLMSADILLYGANYVPLGDDQKQHMELTRTLAERFNSKFGDIFVVPESWEKQLKFAEREISVRIRSLARPEKKMSKSVDDPKGTILLTDDPKEAAKKVSRAATDSDGDISFNYDKQPGISNLLVLAAELSDTPLHEVVKKWQGQSKYGELKAEVATLVESFLRNFQKAHKKHGIEEAEKALSHGEVFANEIAEETLGKVQRAVGIRT